MREVSVVVLSWNTLRTLQKCLAVLRRNTRAPYELILVDNGSTDGSAQFVRSQAGPRTRAILLDENVGFAAGCNRGIRAATGSAVCLLNSDAFVRRGWLTSMLRCMERTGAGLVGPWTNYTRGKQCRKAWNRMLPGFLRAYQRVNYLAFFCVLIARRVLERVGPLDERFSPGTYEDDDYCQRAALAGFELFIDGRSWVWHQGHRSTHANGLREENLLIPNQARFEEKWEGLIY